MAYHHPEDPEVDGEGVCGAFIYNLRRHILDRPDEGVEARVLRPAIRLARTRGRYTPGAVDLPFGLFRLPACYSLWDTGLA